MNVARIKLGEAEESLGFLRPEPPLRLYTFQCYTKRRSPLGFGAQALRGVQFINRVWITATKARLTSVQLVRNLGVRELNRADNRRNDSSERKKRAPEFNPTSTHPWNSFNFL